MWIRYKHRFAYGEDRKWSYIEIPDDWKTYGYDEEAWEKDEWKKGKPYDEEAELGEYLYNEERIHSQYDHSDKYRGIEYEIVEGLPPNDELLKRLERAQSNADYWLDESTRLREMVDQTGILTKKDTNIT